MIEIAVFVREIVLDTETTGLDPKEGHRIVEIGCLELINHMPSGITYHAYVNPERNVSEEATAISGLTYDFLRDYPTFKKISDDFCSFIKDSTLVIHNARFDISFLNSEFKRLNKPLLSLDNTIDTLFLARTKFPGSPANLDALCRRFKIDLSKRTKHGALIDVELLADVYFELIIDKQETLNFDYEASSTATEKQTVYKPSFPERSFHVCDNELEKHTKLLKMIKNPLWNRS
ncbi:MAG: DNA polymerase III subunit epsilon [Alphaproteobacteria bacterium]